MNERVLYCMRISISMSYLHYKDHAVFFCVHVGLRLITGCIEKTINITCIDSAEEALKLISFSIQSPVEIPTRA